MGMKNRFNRFFELDGEDEFDPTPTQESPSFSKGGENRKNVNQTVPIINTKREKINNKVVPFNQQPTSKQAKITILEPRVYSEVQGIADILLEDQSVVLNFVRMDEEQAKRIVDFLTGTVYALGGDIQRIGDEIFLCTPENVSIDGTLTDIMREKELY
ncbi:cell division protein SepF [Carnobacterium funditum]|uniref:cell division protein SepF n=1 Tax=Carnobacterium funditum TaxID=2752 RepID=UPI000558E41A|nr:cell division protein SepF [Carnobacterium funditum]